MSTTRSLITGRPLIGSTVIGLSGLRSLSRALHASRLRPLIRMASEPHTPWAQDRRNVSEPSDSHLILCSASSRRSVPWAVTVCSSQYASSPCVSGGVAADLEGDLERRDLAGLGLGGGRALCDSSHQYFRSIGWYTVVTTGLVPRSTTGRPGPGGGTSSPFGAESAGESTGTPGCRR